MTSPETWTTKRGGWLTCALANAASSHRVEQEDDITRRHHQEPPQQRRMRRRRARTPRSQETTQRRRSKRCGSGSLFKNRRRQHQGSHQDTDIRRQTCPKLGGNPVTPPVQTPCRVHPYAADDNQHKPLQVTEADIHQAIRSFPAGSSGGPDGLCPQHILELATCKEIGTDLLSSITTFTNLLLEGKCHDEVAPIIFGGSLISLTKKSGGIRPIATSYAWRRLAAKCANTYA